MTQNAEIRRVPKAPLILSGIVLLVEIFGFYEGNRIPLVAWLSTGLAILLSVAAFIAAIRGRSRLGIAAAVLAMIGTVPMVFLSMLWYACAFGHSCL